MAHEFIVKNGLIVQSGSLTVSGSIIDATGAAGTTGQVIASSTTGYIWQSTGSYMSPDSASIQTKLNNSFASQSNYLSTASFRNDVTGSNDFIPMFSGSNFLRQSIMYQSGSLTGSAILVGGNTTGSVNNAILQVYGNTYHSGGIYDSSGQLGSANQVLIETAAGILWVTNPGFETTASYNTDSSSFNSRIINVFASQSNYISTGSFSNSATGSNDFIPLFSGSNFLRSSILYQSGSTGGTGSSILVGGNTTGSINRAILQVYGNEYLSGSLYDSTGAIGVAGQVLIETATGVLWVTNPGFAPSGTFNASTASFNTFSSSYVTDSSSFNSRINTTNTNFTNFSSSYVTDSSSFGLKIANVFASESNYVLTSSFVNIGTISGSGVSRYLTYYSSSTSLTSSLAYQSGSGTGSAILIGGNRTGSIGSLLQIYGSAYVSGSIYDSTGANGNSGQVLAESTTGIVWINTGSFDITQLNQFSASILNYTSSTTTTINNVFASQSNYTTTSSFNTVSSSLYTVSGSDVTLSASYHTDSGSNYTKINNIFASESNYLLTSSFVNIGTLSGSGTINTVPVFTGVTSLGNSIMYQSGSGTGSAVLINGNTTGSFGAKLQIFGSAYISQSIYDSTGTPGTSGQVLSSTVNGLLWIAPTSSSITGSFGISGSGVTNFVPLFSGSFALTSSILSQSANTITVAGNIYISGSIYDSTNSTGSINEFLVTTPSGIKYTSYYGIDIMMSRGNFNL